MVLYVHAWLSSLHVVDIENRSLSGSESMALHS